jgi:hypothetical protein
MSEPLYFCEFCSVHGFTRRGLRQHWCPSKPGRKKKHRETRQLTHKDWLTMVTNQDCANEDTPT